MDDGERHCECRPGTDDEEARCECHPGADDEEARCECHPGADDEEARCECHPGLAATGRCEACGEDRCALCFEDGRNGLCRDCAPQTTGIGKIRPSLRIVHLPPPPPKKAVALLLLSRLAGGTLFLMGLCYLSGQGPLADSAWARWLARDERGILAAACFCVAAAFTLATARPPGRRLPQKKELNQSQKVSK